MTERDVQRALGTTPRWCVHLPFKDHIHGVRVHLYAVDESEALEIVRQLAREGHWNTLNEVTFDFSKVVFIPMEMHMHWFDPSN